MKLLIQLVREILHLSGKSQGKVREFQTPMAVATMLYMGTFRLGPSTVKMKVICPIVAMGQITFIES